MFNQIVNWIGNWVRESVFGGDDVKLTAGSINPLMIEMERSTNERDDLSLGCRKNFGSVDWECMCTFMSLLGFPKRRLDTPKIFIQRVKKNVLQEWDACEPTFKYNDGKANGRVGKSDLYDFKMTLVSAKTVHSRPVRSRCAYTEARLCIVQLNCVCLWTI